MEDKDLTPRLYFQLVKGLSIKFWPVVEKAVCQIPEQ